MNLDRYIYTSEAHLHNKAVGKFFKLCKLCGKKLNFPKALEEIVIVVLNESFHNVV